MKSFEISSRKNKNGKRHFKAILCRVFPDSCVDEVEEVGRLYNKNGITFLESYCEKALPSIEGMSLRVEFVDEDRVEILSHGETDIIDGEPIFEDATVIGTFTKGYIEDVETEDGTITACVGEGYIDASCYHNFTVKLQKDADKGIFPSGSVEIMRTDENDAIIYKYGYKETGRIPMDFRFSGYALLNCEPADDSAKLIELNNKNKEEICTMNDVEIKALVEQTVAAMTNHTSEINQVKIDCEKQIAELNECLDKEKAEKNEIIADSDKIKAALEEIKKEYEELNKKWEELWNEKRALEKALAEAQANERIGELNAAIADFSDAEKEYAKAEIDAFNADPITSEINSVVSKIYEGIGKKAKEDAAVAELNSANKNITVEDIFSAVDTASAVDTDTNIF